MTFVVMHGAGDCGWLEIFSATLGRSGLAITADVYAKVGANLQRQAAYAMENRGGDQ